MRPGPGLVVMALAFISGARRGSTSTSSKITSSSTTSSSSYTSSTSSFYTSSSSPSLSPSSSSSSLSTDSLASSTSSQSFLFPSYLAGGGVLTPAGAPSPTAPSSDYNYYYHDNYPQPSFVLPEKVRHHYDATRARSKSLSFLPTPTGSSSRATRETRGARNSDIAARAGGGSDNDDNISSSSSSSSDTSSDVDPATGLLVQFPSHSADSSTSFDEDDILALVAEDNLLSEESFDRLTKLTDDKIGYINEEDYAEFGEVATGAGVAGGGGTVGVVENSAESSKSSATSASVATTQELQKRNEVQSDGSIVAAVETDNVGLGGGDGGGGGGGGGRSGDIDSGYVAKLVSKNVATLADSALSSVQQDLSDDAAADFDFKQLGLDSPVFDSTSSLTRINPWLSACDLAQPSTAPDLQGQCTAGTLPVAWVDEGPGPPTCPKSCEQLRLENNKNKNYFKTNTNNNNKYINDNNKYLIDTNSINFKLNQLVNNNYNNFNINNNNNNNNNINYNKIMTKVRRDTNDNNSHSNSNSNSNVGDVTTTAAPTWRTITTTAAMADTALQQQQQQQQQTALHMQQDVAADDETAYAVDDMMLSNHNRNSNTNSNSNNHNSNNNKQSQNNNNIVKKFTAHHLNSQNYDLKHNNLNQEPPPPSSRSSSNNNYNHFKHQQHQQQHASYKSQLRQQQYKQQQEQQCLDYLGDNEESSPSHLCQLQDPNVLAHKLRTLRLRHCCERNVFTALHTIALNATLSGGAKCLRVLQDVMELDSLATRITCELAEILFRFDCRQVYSLINQCDDCKEAYRRWVCSTLIPYFAEQNDTTTNTTKNTNTTNNSNSNNKHNNNNTENNKNYNSTTTSNSTNSSNKHLNNNNSNNSNNNKNKAENRNILINNNKIEYLYKSDNKNNLIINNNNKNLNQANFINNNNNNINNKNNEYFNDNLNKRSERRTGRSTNTARSAVAAFYDAIDYSSSNSNSKSNNNKSKYNKNSSSNSNNHATSTARDADARCIRKSSNDHDRSYHQLQHQQQQQQQQLQQETQQQQQNEANNFISTAKNEDPCVEDPVISKLLKRSKRKVEFRKRRRIRPCLSVCQTVEQKCPYLLPADRAPALPTQYAGEPTFLCLDPNIDETGEQLRKSNHGPPECCYHYCGHPVHGLCTYCNEFAGALPPTSLDEYGNNSGSAIINTTTSNGTAAAPTRRIHNITLSSSSGAATTHQRIGSVAIALLNVSTVRSGELDVERLPSYAYFAGTYYYDDIDEMPHKALPECSPVPSVSSRCTIPYYASTAAMGTRSDTGSSRAMRALMLCLSAMFCLMNSYYVMAVRRWSGSFYCCRMDGRRELHAYAWKRQEISSRKSSSNQRSSSCAQAEGLGVVKLQEQHNKMTKCNNLAQIKAKISDAAIRRYSSSEKCSRKKRSKIRLGKKRIRNNYEDDEHEHKTSSIKCNCSQSRRSRNRRRYSSSQNSSSQLSSKVSTNVNIKIILNTQNNSCNKNYHFHYFYNFNINDLWRRWWIRGGHAVHEAKMS